MKENTTKPVSSFSLFKPSKDAFMRNFPTFAILLIPSALYELFNVVIALSTNDPRDISENLSASAYAAIGVGLILVVIVAIIFGALISKLELEAAKGKTVSFSQLWKSTKSRILPFAGLALSVGFLVLFGLMLFIIPGLFLIKRYSFAPFIFLEDDSVTVSEAMKKSATLTSQPYSGYVWGVLAVTLLMGFVFSWIPVVGSLIAFVLTWLYSVAMPLRYLELKALRKD